MIAIGEKGLIMERKGEGNGRQEWREEVLGELNVCSTLC